MQPCVDCTDALSPRYCLRALGAGGAVAAFRGLCAEGGTMSTTTPSQGPIVEEDGPTDRASELEEASSMLADAHRLLKQADDHIERALQGWKSGDNGQADRFHWHPAIIDLDLALSTVRAVRYFVAGGSSPVPPDERTDA
jgi:hypothetical protein